MLAASPDSPKQLDISLISEQPITNAGRAIGIEGCSCKAGLHWADILSTFDSTCNMERVWFYMQGGRR